MSVLVTQFCGTRSVRVNNKVVGSTVRVNIKVPVSNVLIRISDLGFQMRYSIKKIPNNTP